MSNKLETKAMKPESKRVLKPKLRFPEFQDAPEWNEQKLGAVASLITERAGNKKCIPMSITSGVGLVSQQEKFGRTIAGNQYENYLVLQKNDFAYNKSATKEFPQGFIAKYWGDEPAAVPKSIFACFRAHEDGIVPDFLNYLFAGNLHGKWLKKYIEVSARAHGSLSIDDEDLLSLPIPLPSGVSSRAEQQKIAACLISLDELIAAHGQKLDALKSYKKALMQQLFPRDSETIPRLRFPEFRDAPEWAPHKFGNFVVESFYGTSESTSDKGQYPVLRMGNMVDGGLDFTNLVYIDLDRDNFDAIRLKKGDILLNRTNSRDLVGKISLFEMDSECITASYIVTFRLNTNEVDPSFCNLMLNTQLYQARIKLLATPSISQANINPTTFRNSLDILIPSKPEQQRIASCLSALDDLIAAQTQKLEALKTHKKGLMQQLFPYSEEVEA